MRETRSGPLFRSYDDASVGYLSMRSPGIRAIRQIRPCRFVRSRCVCDVFVLVANMFFLFKFQTSLNHAIILKELADRNSVLFLTEAQYFVV